MRLNLVLVDCLAFYEINWLLKHCVTRTDFFLLLISGVKQQPESKHVPSSTFSLTVAY